MNKNIVHLNNGHQHQPIYKVRKYEKGDKFAVGARGNKSSKFVEAAKGTNLFFAIYEQEQVEKSNGEVVKKRTFATIPLNVVISRQNRANLLHLLTKMEICLYSFFHPTIWCMCQPGKS